MTLSGCVSRGVGGCDCRVLRLMYVYVKEIRIIVGFGLHERCARDVVRPRGLRGVGKAVGVRVWGVWFVSGACYLQAFVFACIWDGFA